MRFTPSPRLVHNIVWGLTRSLRFHLYGLENVARAARSSPTRTVVVCHFHQSLLTILGPHHHLPLAALASLSRDGDVTAAYLESIGLHAVRGSSSRGGAQGGAALMRALRDGYHAVLNVDGPRGPYKIVKAGALEVARRCGVPLVPIVGRASHEFSFKRSWDRFRLPLPFSRVAIIYGEPLYFPSGTPTPAELLARQRALALAMHRLEARASSMVGRRDGAPPRECLAWLASTAENPPPSSVQGIR